MKILIRAYGSHLMGMGHLYRMQKLISKLKEKIKCQIVLITRNYEEASAIYQQIKVDEIIALSYQITETEEIKYLQSIETKYYDFFINDQLNTSIEMVNEIIRVSKKNISFDDNGNGNNLFDKIINVLYPSNEMLDNEIVDFKYLIINDFKEQKKSYNLKNEVKSIFINQGAADTWGAIPDMINDFNYISDDITLVILLGPAFKHFDEFANALKNTNKKVLIYNSVSSVVDIAKDCDIAILGAGNTLFEVASLGIPIIATTREEKELITINRLLREQVVVSSGKIYQNQIHIIVKNLIDDFELRKKLYTKSRDTFDYNGLENITNIILEDTIK